MENNQTEKRAIVEDVVGINWVSDLDGCDIQTAINYFEVIKKRQQFLTARLDFNLDYDGYEAKLYITRYETDAEINKRLQKEEIRRIKQLEGEAKAKAKAERIAREEAERKATREVKERELLAVLKAKYEV